MLGFRTGLRRENECGIEGWPKYWREEAVLFHELTPLTAHLTAGMSCPCEGCLGVKNNFTYMILYEAP